MYLLAGFAAFVALVEIFTPIQVRLILAPWILIETIFHEFGHAFLLLLSGRWPRVELQETGFASTGFHKRPSKAVDFLITSAGYLTAGALGAGLILAGFTIFASKIAHFGTTAICLFIFIVGRKDRVLIPTVLFAVLIPVPFWFLQHARYLRFYTLFVGTAVSFGNLSFLVTTQILRPSSKSDAGHLQKAGFGKARVWGIVWLFLCSLFAAVAILGGIALSHQTEGHQIAQAKLFLPT